MRKDYLDHSRILFDKQNSPQYGLISIKAKSNLIPKIEEKQFSTNTRIFEFLYQRISLVISKFYDGEFNLFIFRKIKQ